MRAMRPSQRSSAARFVPAVTGRKLNYGTGTPPDVLMSARSVCDNPSRNTTLRMEPNAEPRPPAMIIASASIPIVGLKLSTSR